MSTRTLLAAGIVAVAVAAVASFSCMAVTSVDAQAVSSTVAASTSTVAAPVAPSVSVPPRTAVLDGFDPDVYGLAAAYAITPRSRRELYAWNADKPWPVASLSKLVTSLVWKDRAVPWQRVVSLLAKDEVGGGRLRVAVGTKVRFEDLWFASITASANNAAMAVARSLGVTPARFVVLMNAAAKKAGAPHAVFFEPSGMNEKNTASAKEMAAIADAAFQWKPLQRAASTAAYVVRVLGPKPKDHPIRNTNQLLVSDPDVWVIAGKTGYLEESRYNLVAWMRPVGVDGKPESGKDVLVVIYGAPTKDAMFASAKALAQSLWNTHAVERAR